MELFVREDGKTLRCGYTTGTTAALASYAAARLFITGKGSPTVSLCIPAGITVEAEVEVSGFNDCISGKSCGRRTGHAAAREKEEHGENEEYRENRLQCAVCGVRKDGGDDRDVTDNLLILAKIEPVNGTEAGDAEKMGKRVILKAGEGIGTVTKPGLFVPVGEAAINPVPRRMIEEAVIKAMQETGYEGMLKCTISVPEGKKAAASTFNERLGIVGGISIIGTTGIVEPMSRRAYSDAVCLEIRQQAAIGKKRLVLTPGNYGEAFIKELLSKEPAFADETFSEAVGGLRKEFLKEPDKLCVVMCSNFIGDALDEAIADDFERVMIAGHAGKLVKLAGGIMDTHSRIADCRLELICAHAALCGASRALAERIMASVTTDAAFDLLEGEDRDLRDAIVKSLMGAIDLHLKERVRKHERESSLKPKALLFTIKDGEYRILGITE